MLIPLLLLSLSASPLLRDGDRVVFLGDSITVAHTYTRAVEEYVRLRHPELDVTFVNAGVGGHTASDGLARLDVDVLAERPTVVLLNFGMNDTSYPDGTDGAAFAKNMAAIIKRLQGAGVRLIVWIDTSPFDVTGLAKSARSRTREDAIVKLVQHTRDEAQQRGLVYVAWHDPIVSALSSWEAARRPEKLLPDKVHPGPALHAIMATQVLRALGEDMNPPTITGKLEGGALRFDRGLPLSIPWDAKAPIALPLTSVTGPLPLLGSIKDAADLGATDALALRRLLLKLEGLPSKQRYRVKVGDVDVGSYTSAQLVAGVDLMSTTTTPLWVPAPMGSTMTMAATPAPSTSACTAVTGNPFQNDHECLWGLLFQKDQLRIAMRNEKIRWLPDFTGNRRGEFLMLQNTWVNEADAHIRKRAQAIATTPHVVTITPAG
ncbi:MAG: SGNH/GDSL hydrolase family protein [Deltaproteobacteria bacterium]|nr:SGNH/GDSL hydrolase family protein [Deltaproteobacteria bacterium]